MVLMASPDCFTCFFRIQSIAPDMRGYGDTDAPASFHSYTSLHIVGYLIALIDLFGVDQVFVIGHDWGANIASHLCLFCPDKFKALVNLSVHYFPRNPMSKPIRAVYGDDFYVIRFQEPGEIEAEFARVGAETVIQKFLPYVIQFTGNCKES
ncbi:Epoxide hydrolase [Thalictrum thalictroides]|uniref:Epoxide hydrolase n=1 Tax=Thalictrum thalictroides TaxID=46969 RepID=A0A7J6VU91_THATH|nr:Epoxide hydrolase [Thalictrum thalictroides]